MGDKLQGGKIAGDVLNKAKDGKRKLWSTAARCVHIYKKSSVTIYIGKAIAAIFLRENVAPDLICAFFLLGKKRRCIAR